MPCFALPLFVLFMSYYFLTCLYWALYVVNDYIEMASCKTVVLMFSLSFFVTIELLIWHI